ncbi:uncharacterized protein LOC106050450 isoform X2 [Biomphalaria glabrata]|uniref:Uncharacterized protein LOC106050450 isoform X2 n=1 Tax=Biomphalaria glabrata TaxID=6526 RepID=A0A9W3BEV1_BIOGL|nr:uncharacterized protein LOC106050450 isoform X2 [Biomphalaria glabrata]
MTDASYQKMHKMSETSEDVLQQVQLDNKHFKALLDLIPPHAYFKQEEKQELFGLNPDEDENEPKRKKKKKKKKKTKKIPLSSMSVTQITELRLKGETLGEKKKKVEQNGKKAKHSENGVEDPTDKNSMADKQQGKKVSRSSSAKKKKKEFQRRESRLEELKERLRIKLEEIKARKSSGSVVNSQEVKRLKRQEKKVKSKLKSKDKTSHKSQNVTAGADGLKSPPRNTILNQNGEPVKSKFDFSIISFGNDKHKSSELRGRDYKRLLEKVEKQREKVELLKEKDPEAGKKLEKNIQWQNVFNKAKGEKVKDDPNLLKKAVKRKEKIKEKKQKKWGERIKDVKEMKQKRQDKRQANIDKRKDAKKDKKRKVMIKKGRIIPGF